MVVKLVMNHSMGSQAGSKIAVATKQIQGYLAPSRKSFSLQVSLVEIHEFLGFKLSCYPEIIHIKSEALFMSLKSFTPSKKSPLLSRIVRIDENAI